MKQIKCELFGENEYLFFNVMRLMQLEKATGRKITELMSDSLSLGDLMIAYEVGFAKKKRNAAWYADKCDQLFEEGVTLTELMAPVMQALIGSGVLGKRLYAAAFPDEVSEEEKAEIEAQEELEKN